MKTNLYILALAAFAMAATACVTEKLENTDQAPQVATKTITVSFETERLTRTELSSDRNSLSWVNGDSFGIFTDAATDINHKITYATGDTEYTLKVAETAAEIYAYYPWNEANSGKTAKTAVLSIPTAQTQTAGGVFNGNNYPMVSKTVIEGASSLVVLNPVASTLALNVYGAANPGEKVKSITFSSSTEVAGESTVDLTADTPVYTPSSKSATVTLAEGTDIEVAASKPADAKMHEDQIYLTVAKKNYTDGKIVVKTTKNHYTFTLSSAIDCSTCDFKALNLNLAKATTPKYSYEDLLGYYVFTFHNGTSEDFWYMNLKERVPGESYSADCYTSTGAATYQDVAERICFNYTGDDNAPLKLTLRQWLGYTNRDIYISATTSGGAPYVTGYSGYDLVPVDSNGEIAFDFRNLSYPTLDEKGMMIFQYDGTYYYRWATFNPATGHDYLRLTKSLFGSETEQYNFDFTAETVNLAAMPGYTITDVSSSADWLHAEKTEEGLTFTADENRTDSVRDGVITVTVNGGKTATISVNQNTYETLLGRFDFPHCSNPDGTIAGAIKSYVNFVEDVKYESYLVEYNKEDLLYTIKIENKNGTLNMQASQIVLDDWSRPSWGGIYVNKFDFYLRPAKNDWSGYWISTGNSYDLVYSKEGDKICYDMVPDDFLRENGYYSIAIAGYYVETGNVAFAWEFLRPLNGQTYLRITK